MKLYTGYRSTPGSLPTGEPFVPTVSVKDLPERVNWNEKGWLTGVKNQVSSLQNLFMSHCVSVINVQSFAAVLKHCLLCLALRWVFTIYKMNYAMLRSMHRHLKAVTKGLYCLTDH